MASALACAGPRFVLPTGAGAPAPAAPAAWADATARCRGAQTFSSELRISGRAGTRSLRRATVFAGLTSTGQIRLEAPAPFGRAAFILTASGGDATLVTRDNQVLTAPPEQIVEALIGVALGPKSLLTILSGCGLSDGPIEDAVMYPSLLAVRTAEGRAFLQSLADHWRIVAVEREGLVIEYQHDASRSEVWPRELRLRSEAGRTPPVTLSIAQSQIEVNVALAASAFTANVPANATRLTIDDLRSAGPLGSAR